MNAATLDFQDFQEKRSSQKGRVRVQQKRNVPLVKTCAQDEAYWARRAEELLSVHVDESRPTVSGKFGTFLY